MPHQKTVAGVLRRRGIVAAGRVVEAGEDALVAAIAELVEQRAVAFGNVDRLEHVEVGRIFDHPASIARGLVEVDDHGIEGALRIELAVEAAHHLLIGPDIAESCAGRERLLLGDLDPGDTRIHAGCCDHECNKAGASHQTFHRFPPELCSQCAERAAAATGRIKVPHHRDSARSMPRRIARRPMQKRRSPDGAQRHLGTVNPTFRFAQCGLRDLERIPFRFEHSLHGERNSCIPAG